MSKRKFLDNEVKISDLKQLGIQGGATARLLTGEEMKLTKRYGLIKKPANVAGELIEVDVITDYSKVYSQIRTIKRENILIARRIDQGKKSVLTLTGRGYHRNF